MYVSCFIRDVICIHMYTFEMHPYQKLYNLANLFFFAIQMQIYIYIYKQKCQQLYYFFTIWVSKVEQRNFTPVNESFSESFLIKCEGVEVIVFKSSIKSFCH